MNIAVILSDIITTVTGFVRAHEYWAMPLVFLLAFGESLAFISLLLPATVILIALGALVGESGISFMPVWLAASAGAFFGDWVSYYLGDRYKDQVAHVWPMKKYPQMLERGHAFFERWGVLGIFIGRFFGPLRAVVPLVAGICTMPMRHFQLVNLASALVWAFLLLAPGAFGLPWLAELME